MEERQGAVESLGFGVEFWRGRRVLITGHTGFKGSWLAALMERSGAQTLGIALAPPGQPNHFDIIRHRLKIESIYLDIREFDSLRAVAQKFQPEFVFHLAAQALVRESSRAPIDTFAANVMGTVHVLEACRGLQSLRAVVAVTTDKCYENHGHNKAFKESDRLGGHDPYSSSKACAELAVESLRQSFWREAIEQGRVGLATARAGNVIGGGDWSADRIIPDIIRACARGEPAKIRNPKSIRPWQHVLDPLMGYARLAERLQQDPRQFSRAWNFGPGVKSSSCSVEDILGKAKKILGERLKWDQDPGPHPHEASILKLDCAQANNELSWRAKWEVEDSVRETFRWYEAYFRSSAAAADMTMRQIDEFGAA